MQARENQILFKRTTINTIFLADVYPPINLAMTYFYMAYDKIPFSSGRFVDALKTGELVIINGTDSIPDGIEKSRLEALAVISYEDIAEPIVHEKIKKEVKLGKIRSVFELLGIQKAVPPEVVTQDSTANIVDEETLVNGVNSFLLSK